MKETENGKCFIVPSWAINLADLIASDLVLTSTIQVYEGEVRALVADPKLNSKYTSNYEQFIDANCVGCVTGITDCEYLGRDAKTKVARFKELLEGKADKCPIRVNGTICIGPQTGGRLMALDLTSGEIAPVNSDGYSSIDRRA